MDEGDILRRLDRHLARGNELVERNTEALERNREAFDRNAEAFDRNAEAFDRNAEAFDRVLAAFDDQHTFMREITLRVERAGREQIRQMRRQTDEVVEELRAQRGALLAILDRLDPGGPNASA